MNLVVVAEGIENEAHLTFFKEHSKQKGQGFYLAKPMPPEGVENLFIVDG
jgi:EAL domain-containing protein (putative c-di-GMP-specific phosphodiesterase class I)